MGPPHSFSMSVIARRSCAGTPVTDMMAGVKVGGFGLQVVVVLAQRRCSHTSDKTRETEFDSRLAGFCGVWFELQGLSG